MSKKFETIVRYIEKQMETNELKQGERLPSIRIMAERFRCNKATVIRAYEELILQHRVYTIPKSGYYRVEKKCDDYKVTSFIDFYEAVPEPKMLPFREFTHCINRAVELYKDKLFLCTEVQGMKTLRSVLKQYFGEQQVFASDEEICITSGSQQALHILSNMPFPNGKTGVLVEQPTYRLMQEMLNLNGIRVVGIMRGFEGIDLNELEWIFREEDIKFFYTIPRFQNPLGTCYSEKEKKKIIELAEKYDVYIVEDDYFADIETNSKALPMHYYDTCGKVIYIRSFSKTFMPGIRLGVAVLPRELLVEFLNRKRCQDQSTSVLSQGALEIFIGSGMYKKHTRKIQIEYQRKMNCLQECLKGLKNHEIMYHIPQTGFCVWIKLPEQIPIHELIMRLKNRNIRIRAADDFYKVFPMNDNSIRIAISNAQMDQIRKGMHAVVEELNRYSGL